jgi:hypothetical protein
MVMRASLPRWLAIPLAMARTAIGFVAQMRDTDSEEGIHSLAWELMPDFVWGRTLLDDLEEWQRTLHHS